jgi:hypothetical protein
MSCLTEIKLNEMDIVNDPDPPKRFGSAFLPLQRSREVSPPMSASGLRQSSGRLRGPCRRALSCRRVKKDAAVCGAQPMAGIPHRDAHALRLDTHGADCNSRLRSSTLLIDCMALTINITCCNCTRSHRTRGNSPASCVPTVTPVCVRRCDPIIIPIAFTSNATEPGQQSEQF